ncbi:MAG: heparinase II/III family protein [Opitutales bacterium]
MTAFPAQPPVTVQDLPRWRPEPRWVQDHRERLVRLLRALAPEHVDTGTIDGSPPAAVDDLIEALARLHRHCLQKPPVAACLPPFLDHERLHQINAGRVMNDTFVIQHIIARQPRRPDGGLDWRHRGPRRDKEWAWILNRQGFLRSLVVAWRTTGNPRYPERADRLIDDWIRSHPHPGRFTSSAAWRPLEAARRIMDSWVEVFFAFAGEPAFRPETRLLMLASLHDHGLRLRRHHYPGGNHLLTEMAGLTTLAVTWPEFRDSEDWLAYAETRVMEELEHQVYPDGSHRELANHYQRLAIDAFEQIDRMWATGGRREAYARLREHLVRLWGALADVRLPDGSGPMNNDSGEEPNAALLRKAVDRYPESDWGAEAAPGHRFRRWAGQVIIRSGWEETADWLWFDAGPRGSDHQHEDFLHVSLCVGGVPVLVDPGRFQYRPGPWRNAFTGATAHNVLLWNHRACLPPPDTVREPLPVTVEFEANRAWAAAEARFPPQPAQGRAGPRWSRTVLWLADGRCVVADWIDPRVRGTLTACWQFHPDRAVTPEGSGLRIRLCDTEDYFWQPWPDDRRDAWSLDVARGRREPEPRGWYSREFNRRIPAASVRACLQVDRPGYHIWQGWRSGGKPGLLGMESRTTDSLEALTLSTVAGAFRLVGPNPAASQWV